MLAVQEKAMGVREAIDIHLKVRCKTLDIPARQINESGLFAAKAASAALEGW